MDGGVCAIRSRSYSKSSAPSTGGFQPPPEGPQVFLKEKVLPAPGYPIYCFISSLLSPPQASLPATLGTITRGPPTHT